jgi:hypothetical protein
MSLIYSKPACARLQAEPVYSASRRVVRACSRIPWVGCRPSALDWARPAQQSRSVRPYLPPTATLSSADRSH